MAAFATLVCQRNCVFLCKGTKLQKAALFAIVCRFLVLPPLRLLPKKQRFSLQRQKAPEFGIRRILGQYAGSRFGMFFRL